MPTLITHAIVGASAAGIWEKRRRQVKFIALSLICPIIPDLDVIGFRLGISYEDVLGHRGFFHSLPFALIVGLMAALVFLREEKLFSAGWWKLAGYFGLLTASHGILDALTNGGLGIALLSPFDNTRYFFPWTPIKVSPINVHRFLSPRGFEIIRNEALWIWLPAIMFTAAVNLFRMIRKRYS